MNRLLAHPKTKLDLDGIVAAPRACYMLVGEPGSGKMASARYVAEQLECSILDVIHLAPNEKGVITIEAAHQLLDQLSKHPSKLNGYRTVIIESAESMTVPAQNALLKVIEEPPTRTIFLLLLNNSHGILSTIRSRCQNIYMRSIAEVPGNPEVERLARGRAGLATAMLNDQRVCDMQIDITSRAQAILNASPLERIALADTLATQKDRAKVINELAYEVSARLRTQNATSQALQSMQNYFIYSNAGVASKHALMEMMIRL